jgi:hypothetical protein
LLAPKPQLFNVPLAHEIWIFLSVKVKSKVVLPTVGKRTCPLRRTEAKV